MNIISSESADRLSGPRRMIAALEKRVGGCREPFPFGHAGIDERLGGGLARGRLHELFACEPDDAVTASACALMLAQRASPDAPILWVGQETGSRRGGTVFGSGLVELGLDPGRFIFAIVADMTALLRAADEILRCHRVGALIVEAWGRAPALDLTASRRLALAAERSGVTALLMRADASPSPSAAQTRWEVRAAPSAALLADAPGAPAMEIRLLRHRAGLAEQSWRLEWDRDRLCFRETALPGAVVPLSVRGPAAVALGERWELSA